MGEELGILLGASPLLLLLAPSLITGLVLIFCAFRLFKTLGGRFLDVQDRQAASFEKIAASVTQMVSGIEQLKEHSAKDDYFTTEVRITLRSIEDNVGRIDDKINKLLDGKNENY
jgi:hypothetical protein